MEPVVELKNLTHVYVNDREASLAVEGLNLTVHPGEFISLVGPSGCGKTTILSMIAGLLHPTNGEVLVYGRKVEGPSPDVGYMLQQDYLFPWRTILQNAAIGLEVTGRLQRESMDHLTQLLDEMGLEGTGSLYPQQLSGGMRQRVALVRTLSTDPGLLLLDEPFSALDTPRRMALRREFLALQGEFEGITLLVTHDPQEAALLADEILILEDGRPLQAGVTQDVFRRPVSELAARLLGADNAAEGLAAGNRIEVGHDAWISVSGPPLGNGRVGWSIPPDRTWISAAGAHQGVVEAVNGGPEPQLLLRFGDTRIRVTGAGSFTPGQVCRFDIDPERIQVWPLG